MLIQHSFQYLLGRIIPGAVSLLALALYTRLMSSDQYGLYALTIAAMSMINAVCFQWLNLSLGRFLPAHEGRPQKLLATSLIGFLMLVVATGVLGLAVAWLWPDKNLRWLIIFAVTISWAQAWFDLNLKLVNARLEPIRYGLLSSIKASIAVSLGTSLLYLGLGVPGILLGLMVGLLVSPLLVRKHWLGLSVQNYDTRLLKDFIVYGAPLTLAFLLTLVLDVSDRFFLGWFMNAKVVGAYAAAYDLAQLFLGMLMGIVHLAAFPLAVRALEEEGYEGACNQLRQNALLLLSISLPATVGLVLLAGNVVTVVLGVTFRKEAAIIIRIVALAIFVGGLKSFYFDYSFQLARKMRGQVLAILLAAIANVGFNLWWIPVYGALGAAYATLGAFIVGLFVSVYLGRKAFVLPPFPKEAYKVVLASAGMSAFLLMTLRWHGPAMLCVQVILGCCVYVIFLVTLNVGKSRLKLKIYFGRIKQMLLPVKASS
ncbi:MAG: hypothetical protein A2029_12985 [Chloroflexi bacterium RBG_19FT_COMBO_47_9]|nr:MAG: hypothetical protein A2029_12985 [Chloroflexi bacterium RBG_19FT_COMBO_47_9]